MKRNSFFNASSSSIANEEMLYYLSLRITEILSVLVPEELNSVKKYRKLREIVMHNDVVKNNREG